MRIYEYKDYKKFLNDFIASKPKRGRGEAGAIAKHLEVEPSVITLILKHDRDFSQEQALKVSRFYAFDMEATDFFIHLVNLKRADTRELKEYFISKLEIIREAHLKKKPVEADQKISAEHFGTYYSNWYYAAAWLLTSVPEFRTIDALSRRLNLSRQKVGKIVSFLLEAGLCTEDEDGNLLFAQRITSVDSSSEYLNNHRRNWRDRARVKFTSEIDPTDYFMSFPMGLSKEHAEQFHKELRELVQRFGSLLVDSPEETFRCLNIDWFSF